MDEPPYPAYIAKGHKQPHWVFLGAVDDYGINTLVEQGICWMSVPPIAAEAKNRDVVLKLFHGDGFYAVEVGEDQYRSARSALTVKSSASHVVLDDFQEHPTVVFPPPSDHELAVRFLANKSIFEQLRTMLLKDKALSIVGDDWTQPRNATSRGFPITKYRELVAKISPSRCWVARGTVLGDIQISEWGFGATVCREASEEIVYNNKRPQPLVRVIDPYRASLKQRSEQYRRISGDWYVRYEFSP